jgi:hypothetical protein
VLWQTQQIFLTTHSPYIFQENHQIRNVFICKKNENIIITPTNNLCLFGQYSPTWWEINYIAYNLPTIEFHNELYWYIQAKAILEDEKYYNPKEFDNYLVSKWLTKDQKYRHLKLDQSVVEYDTTLSTKIRNIIHHPENTNNDPLNEQELKNSIAQIISLIQGEDL